MNTRYSWSQIKKEFSGKWVELTDFEWDWNSAHPSWARVRNHASDRSELIALIEFTGKKDGAVILYVGQGHNTFVSHDSAAAVL
jgi:hypothetical protein